MRLVEAPRNQERAYICKCW